jgi:UV DNA damage endonuclease
MKESNNTNLGYACINLSVPYSSNRGMIKKTFLSKGIEYAGELALNNVRDLIEIVKWNHHNNIKVFRMSSAIFPWMSEYELEDLSQIGKIKTLLTGLGALAKKYDQRLSFHPGPFNQLGSVNPNVVEKTIKELDQHSQILDMMGLDANYLSKINIHVGNAAGGKEEATNRFCENFYRLGETTKKRLVVENDDKEGLYTVKDLHDLVYSKIKTPITFDYLHHYCNPGSLSEKEALDLAVSTWGEYKPCAHYSSSKRLFEDNSAKTLAHADYVYEKIETYGHSIDIVLEAKKKNLAVENYLKLF